MPGPLELTCGGAPLFQEALKQDLERVLGQIEIALGIGIGTTQPEWYVNSATGDDTADGATAATALKTLAALDDRMGFCTIRQYTQIHLSGDFSNEGLVLRSSSGIGPGGTPIPIAIFGETTTLATGTITAVANQTVGAAGAPQLTDPTVTNWDTAGPGGSSLLRKRLQITAAPGRPEDVGKYVWLKQDAGGGAVVTSFPSSPIDPSSGALPSGVSLTGLSVPPYDYVVEDLTKIGGVAHSPPFLTRVNIVNIEGSGVTDTIIEANAGFINRLIVFDGCNIKFTLATMGFPGFFGCRLESPDFFGVGAFVSGCLIDDGPITNSSRQLFLAGNTMAIGNSLYMGSELGAASSFCGIIAGGASCYDAPGTAVQLEIGSTLHAFGGLFNGTLHGTGNNMGVDVGTNSALSYDTAKSTAPTITGVTEVRVGTTLTTWAAIDATGGFIETAPPTLARVVKK